MNDPLQDISDRLNKYNELLARCVASLEAHMRRTDLVEKRLELIEGRSFGLLVSIVLALLAILATLAFRR